MALVSLSLTVFDDKGKESIITLYTSDSFTIGTLANAMVSLVPIIGQMITGGLRPKATFSVTVDLTVAPTWGTYDAAALNSDVEERIFYEFNTTQPLSIKKGAIPTADEGLIVAGTRQVDVTDAAWLAFQVAMLSGLATTDENSDPVTVLFNDRYENDLTSRLAAYESFASSRGRP